jgi:ribosomal protein L37E
MNRCERCDRVLLKSVDHLCDECGTATGHDVRAPWWGNFANHHDAQLDAFVRAAATATLARSEW